MQKQILYNTNAREKIKAGIDLLANAVKVTMGANGRNVVIATDNQIPFITKDGVTVANHIELEDPIENVGAQIIKNVARRTADIAGDGTTTATVLAQAIFAEGHKMLSAGAKGVDLKKGIDKALLAVVAQLKTLSISVGDDESMLKNIATISANGDDHIGGLIAEGFSKIGKNGVVYIEPDKTSSTTTLEIVEGLKCSSGFLSPYFITNAPKNSCELVNPQILICDQSIGNIKDLIPVLNHVVNNQQQLLIIADDLHGEALSSILLNRMKNNMSICAIKSPSYGEYKNNILKDISVSTGAKICSENGNYRLDNQDPDSILGIASKAIVYKDTTTFIKGGGEQSMINFHCNDLKSQIKDCKDAHDKSILEDRLANLSNGIAILHVGAISEIELRERIDRVDDAIRATKSAIEEGILPGGGSALIKCSPCLDSIQFANEDEKTGIDIIRKSLLYPISQICENAGVHPVEIIKEISGKQGMWGYNVLTERVEDLMLSGVIDPTKVVRVALENAGSVSSLLLTTDCLIVG